MATLPRRSVLFPSSACSSSSSKVLWAVGEGSSGGREVQATQEPVQFREVISQIAVDSFNLRKQSAARLEMSLAWCVLLPQLLFKETYVEDVRGPSG